MFAPLFTVLVFIALLVVAIRDERKFNGNVPAHHNFGIYFGGTVLATAVTAVSMIVG